MTLSEIKSYIYIKAMNILPDDLFLKLRFKRELGYSLDLKNPRTYNEKIQWLKLYDRNPKYTSLVDKILVKKHISDVIGNKYVIPTLFSWDSPDEINVDSLPDKFVLKCNHNSVDGLYICTDKSKMNWGRVKHNLKKALNEDFYLAGREWPYKNVNRKILAEPYLEDNITGQLKDYKFLCFNGKPAIMFIASDRTIGETKFDYFDMEFNRLDLKQHYPNSPGEVLPPINFSLMKDLATELSKGYPHIRIDFYECNTEVFVGELTFYHFGGFTPFEPSIWDYELGDLIDLSLSYKYKKE